MVTGNATATSNSVFIRPILEDALAKILNSIECENVFTEELPPINTETDFLDRLVVHKGLSQPEYEGWFMRRDNMSVNANGISNQYQYEMVHGIMVSGLAFHGDFHRSYQYIQDKTEELVWTLEKNKNILNTLKNQLLQHGLDQEDIALKLKKTYKNRHYKFITK